MGDEWKICSERIEPNPGASGRWLVFGESGKVSIARYEAVADRWHNSVDGLVKEVVAWRAIPDKPEIDHGD